MSQKRQRGPLKQRSVPQSPMKASSEKQLAEGSREGSNKLDKHLKASLFIRVVVVDTAELYAPATKIVKKEHLLMQYTVAGRIMSTLEGGMIMSTEEPIGTDTSALPLTRADVEQLRSTGENATQLDLHLQNLQEIDLSYMDLQGANLQGANLQGANLRGTNLREANLQGANLSEADLDGADLSRASMGKTETHQTNLHGAKLSYATLRELDLQGFNLAELDLQNADLNGTDLRGAVLRGANLQGADLSTARLNGPELQGAILHYSAVRGFRGQDLDRGKGTRKQVAPAMLLEEHFSSSQEPEGKQIVSEREAYLFGQRALLVGVSPVKLHELFPQGFAFAQAHSLFERWLLQTGNTYNEQTQEAMWIGFAQRICDLYYDSVEEIASKMEPGE